MVAATALRLYRKRHRKRPLRGAVSVLKTGNQPFSMLLLQHLKLYADARFRYARWHLGAGHGPHGMRNCHFGTDQANINIGNRKLAILEHKGKTSGKLALNLIASTEERGDGKESVNTCNYREVA